MELPENSHYGFKAQGKPCSCAVCSPYKFSRKVKHKASELCGEKYNTKKS